MFREITRFTSTGTSRSYFLFFTFLPRFSTLSTSSRVRFLTVVLQLLVPLLAEFRINAATRARKNKRQMRYIKEIRNRSTKPSELSRKTVRTKNDIDIRESRCLSAGTILRFSPPEPRGNVCTFSKYFQRCSSSGKRHVPLFLSRKYRGKTCTQFDLY